MKNYITLRDDELDHLTEDEQIEYFAGDILNSENFKSSDDNVQHGTVSVLEHSLDVARASIKISRFLHMRAKRRELIRGALLHDFFLYDWHVPAEDGEERKLHGFYHPGVALRNARKEFDLSKLEQDIIKKHMWPLTIIPPRYKESWVVTAADKYCSLRETLHLRKGRFEEKIKQLKYHGE
ncbi:MAG: phosphohydrolase [Lachnospiraceae bacterium]|nr:phosphohydrolase [Lachnospiraceae bacterium]